jgi:hypothetical protein
MEARTPYDFSIIHSSGRTRTLSIIHPAVQRRFVEFYETNADILLYLCSRSHFSLRSPTRIASNYVEKALMDTDESTLREPGPEEERDGFDVQTKFASSFFEYRKYAYIYKFYQSIELLRLEKRFRFLLKFDIARCFNSIYTHSITWAAKSKEFAKANKEAYTVENVFDKLMQAANYDETHGIVIGPEASRIFSEIILQRVDIDVQRALASDGLRFKVDYNVRRYVDDYFVFATCQKTAKAVFSKFEEALKQYKLYINESKTVEQRTPLMSAQSIAKSRAGRALDLFFNAVTARRGTDSNISPTELFSVSPGRAVWRRAVEDLELIERETKAGYEGLVGFCLGVLKARCGRILSKRNRKRIEQERASAAEFCVAVLEIAFFLHAMDMRVRPTYVLAQIVSVVSRAASWMGLEFGEIVQKTVLDELVSAIDRLKVDSTEVGVEMANLLIVLRSLGSGYRMSAARLAECFGLRISSPNGPASLLCEGLKRLRYFEIVSLLYCMGDDAEYQRLQSELLSEVLSRYASTAAPHRNTELTLLFFDLVSCPHIGEAFKSSLIGVMSKACGIKSSAQSVGEVSRIIRYCTDRIHWVDWNGALNLVSALEKKELRMPYGE